MPSDEQKREARELATKALFAAHFAAHPENGDMVGVSHVESGAAAAVLLPLIECNGRLRQDWRTLTDALHHDGIIDDNGEPTDLIHGLRTALATATKLLGWARDVMAIRETATDDEMLKAFWKSSVARLDAFLSSQTESNDV